MKEICRALRNYELREPVTPSNQTLRYAPAFMFHTLKISRVTVSLKNPGTYYFICTVMKTPVLLTLLSKWLERQSEKLKEVKVSSIYNKTM